MMKSEIVQKIYNRNDEEGWVIVETNKGLYSMRLGGFKKEMDKEILKDRTEIIFPYKGSEIKDVLTDEEWVYVVLVNGGVIASGWVDASFEGKLELGVKFVDISEYEAEFFQSTLLSKLIIGVDNWSKTASD